MSKISLIISREYTQRVRKRSFILTTLLMPLFFIGIMAVPAFLASYDNGEEREIEVYDASGIVGGKLQDSKTLKFGKSEVGYPDILLQYPHAAGYLIIGEDFVSNPDNAKLYMRGTSTFEMEQALRRQLSDIVENQRIAQSNVPDLDSLIKSVQVRVAMQTYNIDENTAGQGGEKEANSAMSMGMAYFGGFLIYMFVLMYGVMVMQGVIEEKSSRILEVMVGSVKPFQLMMGKILGIAFVALTQVAIWIVLIGAGLAVVGGVISSGTEADAHALSVISSNAPDVLYMLKFLICFILYFVGGYLLYAAMYAAVGSGVDNVADTQQLQMPVTMPLIIAIMVMLSAMKDPTGSIAFWFSMIPFTSPIVMMARIAYDIPIWEVITSLVILYGSFIGMTWFAAKIYRVGIFMYGKKPSLKEIIKWSKYSN